jgi:4-amino-4-deoxy-L-arabinose transferase-like glycosyltransferase
VFSVQQDDPVTKRERVVLGVILAVALALRVAWCFHAARLPAGGLHDPNFYYLYGQQLANGNGYRLLDGSPTAYYPPGYAMALAPFMWLGYHWPLNRLTAPEVGIVATLNIAWQLGTIVCTYLVARRVTGRQVAGFVAAGVLALWPNLIFHTAAALTESLFLCLLLVALLLAVPAPWATGWERWRIVAVGVVLGAATLVRPVTAPVFPLLVLVFLVGRAGWRRAIVQSAAITGVAIAVLVPWAIRNAIVMDQVTLSTNTGDNLCMSRHVGGQGGFEFPNDECFVGIFDELERPEFELARDRHGREVAVEFVKEHPGEEMRLWFRRIGAMFVDDADGLAAVESYADDPWMDDGERDLLRTLATTYGALAGVAGVAGLAVLLRRRGGPSSLLLVLTAVGLLTPPVIFFGDPRFHVPAVPIVAIGVGALVTLLRYPSAARTA